MIWKKEFKNWKSFNMIHNFPKRRWQIARLFLSDQLEKMTTPPKEEDLKQDLVNKECCLAWACWVKKNNGEWIKGIYISKPPACLYRADICELITDDEKVYLMNESTN